MTKQPKRPWVESNLSAVLILMATAYCIGIGIENGGLHWLLILLPILFVTAWTIARFRRMKEERKWKGEEETNA